MFEFLKKPYSEPRATGSKLTFILAFGLFIFLFLYFFKPFGLSQVKPLQQLFITFGFGLVTAVVLLVFQFLIEPRVINEKWTMGKHIIWVILIASSIGVANYFYIALIFGIKFSVRYFFYSIWTAILVGSIPVTISFIIVLNRKYKNALRQADVPDEMVFWEDEVVLRAGNSKNEFRINPKNIIYLCSNDNYVTIVTIRGEVLNKTTIRGTLKSAESELKKNNRFLRCHKCFIVNRDFVERVTGNNQNMKIKLLPSGTEIPVSRSKADLVASSIKRN